MEEWVLAAAASPWLYPIVFLLVVSDAFLVVVPSETVVVALGALAGATGVPSLWLLVPIASFGAIVGDLLCFLIGRAVGLDRWAWQRRGRLATALSRVRGVVLTRTAVLVFTARYIPFARIAVNLTAGASGLSLPRFLPLSAAAGLGWALYNVGVGAAFGAWLRDQPVLAVALSVVVAVTAGILADFVLQRVSARWAARRAERDPDPVRT